MNTIEYIFSVMATAKKYAEILGVTERTAYNKIKGSTEFKTSELKQLAGHYTDNDILKMIDIIECIRGGVF